MAVMQRSGSRILGQIVYVGPGLSGKTTNLTVLAAMLPRTRLTMFPTANERTAFFEELPVRVPPPGGWHAAFLVQTVPGRRTRSTGGQEMLLASPDAVVFVADSDPRRKGANRHALDEVKGIRGIRVAGIAPGVVETPRDLEHLRRGACGLPLGGPGRALRQAGRNLARAQVRH